MESPASITELEMGGHRTSSPVAQLNLTARLRHLPRVKCEVAVQQYSKAFRVGDAACGGVGGVILRPQSACISVP
jgi:hypothetical protein